MQIERLVIRCAACLAGVVGLAAPVAAASGDEAAVRAVYRGVSTAVQFDVSPPLRSIPPLPIRPEKHPEIEDRPSGLEGALGVEDYDPLVQSQLGPGEVPTPGVSFDGPSNLASVSPPDPVGDVGPNHYVAMSNLYFAVYSKTGTLLYGPAANNTLWSGFGGPCQTENAGDPVVVHDQLADRWMLTQFTAAGPTWYNCVAVSQTSDPTGAYYRYAFSTGSNFPDYPKYGVWPDALYISTREFAGGSTFAGVGAYAVNRAQLIAGNPAPQVISFLVPPGSTAYNIGDGLLPSDLDGSTLPPAGTPNFFVGSMDNGASYGAPQDALTLWKFTANFTNPPASSFTLTNTIPVAAFDSIFPCSGRACIPQPGTTNKIDILSYRQRPLHRLAYRNFGTHESLVTNQSVEASTGIAGIRWYELRDPNGTPTLHQQGTYAPGTADGIHRWMGSIASDQAGNMALGYSASDGTSTFPSVRYTGRLAGDALGTMPQGEGSFIAGTGSQTGSQRWGDYTSMNVDPVDDCTFWYVNEYVPTTSSVGWRLRIGSFKFSGCGGAPTPDFSVSVSPASLSIAQGAGGTTTATVTSVNGYNSAVGLSCSGQPAGVTCSFAPSPVTPPANGSASSTLTVNVGASVTAGSYSFNVVGTDGSLTRTAALSLTVTGTAPVTVVFTSIAAEDGYVQESSETSNTGGSASSTGTGTAALRVGDLTQDRQLKSVVSFDTSSIPDGATVTAATLTLVRGTLSGTNPFTTHGTCRLDIVTGAFGGANALAASDFQAAATATGVGSMSNPTSNGSSSTGSLNASGLAAINKTGRTQLRVYFTLDDNDDGGNDYVGFYSGDNGTASRRPTLSVTYTP
jgi:hypothetical protein